MTTMRGAVAVVCMLCRGDTFVGEVICPKCVAENGFAIPPEGPGVPRRPDHLEPEDHDDD